jgi:hypothetical protein
MTILKQPLSKLRAKSVSGPRVLIVVASLVTILITLVEMFRGALTIGIGTDESESMSLLEQGINGTWDPDGYWGVRPESIAFTKGNTFQILSHLANIARGNETWGALAYSADSYAVQHLVIVCVALLAVFATGLTAWLLTRDLVASLFSAAALSAAPVFMGHAMFNPKDIPTATGFTLLTTGCIVLLTTAYGGTKNRFLLEPQFWGAVLIFFGFWLGAGVRFALWLPFLLLTFVTAATLWFKKQGSKTFIAPLAGLFGLIAIAISHPHYLPYWDIWVTRSLSNSANHVWGAGIGSLVSGQQMMGDSLAWWYLPAWVLASVPLLLLALICFDTFIAIYQIVNRGLSFPMKVALFLVLTQAFALPLASVVANAIMYNAQRQHLYMYPALAVLAGVGLKWLLDKSNQRKSANSARVWQWVIAATAAFALLYPTIERLRLHPYEYTYLNEVATIGGINGRWETDYYNASLREAITRIPPDVYPYFYAPPENMDTYFYLRGLNYDPKNIASEDEYWRINVTVSGRTMPGNCRDVDSVTRNFRGEDVVMSWVGICKKLPGGPSETQ